MKKWFIAAALPTMVAGTAAAAVRFVPLDEIAHEADSGVVGRVADKYCAWDNEHRIIWTHYVVDRQQTVFGKELAARFELNFAGGTVDGKTMIVTETPELDIGQEYAFFVYDNSKKYSACTVGEHQGLFKIVHNPETGLAQLVNGEGRLMGGDADGKIVTGPTVTVDTDGRIRLEPVSRQEAGVPEADPVIRDYLGREVMPEPVPQVTAGEEVLTPVDLDVFVQYMQDLRARVRGEQQ